MTQSTLNDRFGKALKLAGVRLEVSGGFGSGRAAAPCRLREIAGIARQVYCTEISGQTFAGSRLSAAGA